MAGVATLAAKHYRDRLKLVRGADSAARLLWRRLDPAALRLSWTPIGYALLSMLTQSQTQAAAMSTPYVAGVLATEGITAVPAVNAAMFAGIASDGRPLLSLLEQPLVQTLTALSRGVPQDAAMLTGETSLRMIVGTQVADAGRVADGVAITGTERGGYVRMLNPPSCSRCAILAGQWYPWNAGFQRHPLCDCIAIPAAEKGSGDLTTDPRQYFDSLDKADQNRIFTIAGAEAIRDGADIGQVVNARRGMYTAGGRKLTTEGDSVRGFYGGYTHDADGTRRRRASDELVKRGGRYRQTIAARMMPEQIYLDADGDRARAIELLRKFGYLT